MYVTVEFETKYVVVIGVRAAAPAFRVWVGERSALPRSEWHPAFPRVKS